MQASSWRCVNQRYLLYMFLQYMLYVATRFWCTFKLVYEIYNTGSGQFWILLRDVILLSELITGITLVSIRYWAF